MAPPPAATQPCCVCDEAGGKHCTKCKSRHYCSKACQLVDWKRGHNKACKQLTAAFQDRLLDELMPEKKPKEEPAIVEDVLLADGSKAAARLSDGSKAAAARATAAKSLVGASAKAKAEPDLLGTCAICLDHLPQDATGQMFYDCCCKRVCVVCYDKCCDYDTRCPLCRSPASRSAAECRRRLEKHADKGNAHAQLQLGYAHRDGALGLEKNYDKAVKLIEKAAVQGHAPAQATLGFYKQRGMGCKMDIDTAVKWYKLAAAQGERNAQFSLGLAFEHGTGVAKSEVEAFKFYKLAADQNVVNALYNLGACYANGKGVPQDLDEALKCFERGAAAGHLPAEYAMNDLVARRAFLAR